MRGLILSGIGGLLVFATHSVAPLLSPANVEVMTGVEEGTGRPDFGLVMSRWAWWGLTFQDEPNINTLSEHARDTLRPVINAALERGGLDCKDRWTLTDTFQLTKMREIGIAGHCSLRVPPT